MPDRPILVGALVCAAVTAALADLMTPYGAVVLTLALGYVACGFIAGLASLAAPLRTVLRPAAALFAIHASALLVLVGAWYVAPKPAANERGVIVAVLPMLAPFQDALVTRPHPGRPS